MADFLVMNEQAFEPSKEHGGQLPFLYVLKTLILQLIITLW